MWAFALSFPLPFLVSSLPYKRQKYITRGVRAWGGATAVLKHSLQTPGWENFWGPKKAFSHTSGLMLIGLTLALDRVSRRLHGRKIPPQQWVRQADSGKGFSLASEGSPPPAPNALKNAGLKITPLAASRIPVQSPLVSPASHRKHLKPQTHRRRHRVANEQRPLCRVRRQS